MWVELTCGSFNIYKFVVVQSLSCVRPFVTPWTAAPQASLSFTISWSLLKLLSIESVMPSNHLVLCHPFSSCVQSYYSGLISFKIDWCDFQGTLKSLLQHRCGVASILWCSSFFMVQHSHPYMTAGKTVALTISVSQSSHSVMSDSMRPHESQHARPPCPSPTLGVYPNSGPSSW